MEITIRKAKGSDSTDILCLLEQIALHHYLGRPDIFKGGAKYSPETLSEVLENPDKPVFVATNDQGRVVGYVMCIVRKYKDHAVFKDYTSLYIDDFCVDQDVRGQSLGQKLFNSVKSYAEELGAFNIELNVWEFNTGAINFYERCGFKTQNRHLEFNLKPAPDVPNK